MPTSTLPYEVLLELSNNTSNVATLQLVYGDDEFSTGAIISLQRFETVSLVLNAGSTYKYILQQQGKQLQMTVKTWRDIQCNLTSILPGRSSSTASWTPTEGVTVVHLIRDHYYPC